MTEIEKEHILSALKSCNWKLYGENGAAKLLQVEASTLNSRMKKLMHLRADMLFYYSQAFHFGVQSAAWNAQYFGGATRPGSLTATIFYDSQNMVPLDLIDGFQRHVSRTSG
jgi:hypothetical protein